LAVKYKTHIDTVLYYRAKYLTALGRIEENKGFLQYAESVPVDWTKVKSKITMELDAEKNGRSVGVKA
jgi:intraflagellar transport protein 80